MMNRSEGNGRIRAVATVERVLPWRRQVQTADALRPLLSAFRARHPRDETGLIIRAYEAAAAAHRASCATRARPTSPTRWRWRPSWPGSGLDDVTVAAALLHDAVEDTRFGPGRDRDRVRPRRGRHRRRGHQAGPGPLRLPPGAAGRHHAQDAGRHGQGPAGPADQAGGPAAQHADHRGHAGVEAEAQRPGDPRHLRARWPTASASRTSSGSSRTWPSPPCIPAATPRSSRWWPPGPPSATSTWPR